MKQYAIEVYDCSDLEQYDDFENGDAIILKEDCKIVDLESSFEKILKVHEGSKYRVVDDKGIVIISGAMDPNDIDDIRRELDSQKEKMSLDEYLGIKGVSFFVSGHSLDKCRFPHGLTERQKRKLQKEGMAYEDAYQEKRNNAIADYNELVAAGLIIPKTSLEKTVEKAKYGHPDNESTQAARRLCEKRGIDLLKSTPEKIVFIANTV